MLATKERLLYQVTLRDTRDGYTETLEQEWFNPNGSLEELSCVIARYWTEGSHECDCNRSLRLYPHDESKWLECGDGTIVLESISIGGRELPKEWLE